MRDLKPTHYRALSFIDIVLSSLIASIVPVISLRPQCIFSGRHSTTKDGHYSPTSGPITARRHPDSGAAVAAVRDLPDFVRKPMERVLEQRRERTEGAVAKARADVASAESRTQEYEQKLREARLAIYKAQEARRQQAQQLRTQALAEVRQRAQKQIRQAKAAIEQDMAEARAGLQARNSATGVGHHSHHSQAHRVFSGNRRPGMRRRFMGRWAAILFAACLVLGNLVSAQDSTSQDQAKQNAEPAQCCGRTKLCRRCQCWCRRNSGAHH